MAGSLVARGTVPQNVVNFGIVKNRSEGREGGANISLNFNFWVIWKICRTENFPRPVSFSFFI